MRFKNKLVEVIVTFFYIGYLPAAPGTFASIAGIFLFLLVKSSPAIYFSLVLLLAVLGVALGKSAERLFHKKDPGAVVIDEVLGMLLALALLPCYSVKVILMAFILFRAMDTIKPYPGYLVQSAKAGWGIVADDLVAAFYTNMILQAVLRWAALSCR
ncbi:MAG: phosphatidylglycerophosphatase A [Candidatus Omnitrophica bacterium]|nr:phosphatidylglycerophosphatase A [Candidatus Omnitrophota bacterium]